MGFGTGAAAASRPGEEAQAASNRPAAAANMPDRARKAAAVCHLRCINQSPASAVPAIDFIILAVCETRNMRRIYLSPLLAALLINASAAAFSRVERGNLTFENIPDVPADLTEKLDGYTNARQATVLGWSPKGQLLIATRFGDVDQLHLVEQAGGARRQLTFLHEPVTEASFSPDPARNAIVFLADVGGNENAQLYYQRLGEPSKMLTDGKSRNGAPLWSNSGHEVAFFSNARDGRSYDIDIVDPEADSLPRLAFAGDDSGAEFSVLDWSPDDRKILVRKALS